MSSDEPQNETSGEPPRIFRHTSGPIPTPPPDDTRTSIIRRHPTGPLEPLSDDTRTSAFGQEPTTLEPTEHDETATRAIRPARPVRIPGPPKPPTNATAVAAAAVSTISGWATSVVATGLITGWWRTDRLFCVGVGFLAAVFGACTIAGVVAMLLRRRVGIFLTIVAAVLALLIFSGIFIAGAHMAGVVYAFPALPLATIALAVAPATWRWTK
ncbi:MAG TPA: hypothetical protein VFB19_13135 [Mycobacterium sp.]|nr:hypothetical protein [Mycobacterium sp.]